MPIALSCQLRAVQGWGILGSLSMVAACHPMRLLDIKGYPEHETGLGDV